MSRAPVKWPPCLQFETPQGFRILHCTMYLCLIKEFYYSLILFNSSMWSWDAKAQYTWNILSIKFKSGNFIIPCFWYKISIPKLTQFSCIRFQNHLLQKEKFPNIILFMFGIFVIMLINLFSSSYARCGLWIGWWSTMAVTLYSVQLSE